MKQIIFPLSVIFLLFFSVAAYSQRAPIEKPTVFHTVPFDPAIHHRVQLARYRLLFGIDSLKAIQLVHADEEKNESLRAVLSSTSLDISDRAKAIESLKARHQQIFSRVLGTKQLQQMTSQETSRVYGVRKGNEGNATGQDTSKSELRKMRDASLSRMRALSSDKTFSKEERIERMKALIEEEKVSEINYYKARRDQSLLAAKERDSARISQSAPRPVQHLEKRNKKQ